MKDMITRATNAFVGGLKSINDNADLIFMSLQPLAVIIMMGFIIASLGPFFILKALWLPFAFLFSSLPVTPLVALTVLHAAISLKATSVYRRVHVLQVLALLVNALIVLGLTPFSPFYLVWLVGTMMSAYVLGFKFPAVNLFNLTVFSALAFVPTLPFGLFFPLILAMTLCATLLTLYSQEHPDQMPIAFLMIMLIQISASVGSIFLPAFPVLAVGHVLTATLLPFVKLQNPASEGYKTAVLLALVPFALALSPLGAYGFVATLTNVISPLVLFTATFIANAVLTVQAKNSIDVDEEEILLSSDDAPLSPIRSDSISEHDLEAAFPSDMSPVSSHFDASEDESLSDEDQRIREILDQGWTRDHAGRKIDQHGNLLPETPKDPGPSFHFSDEDMDSESDFRR